MTNDLRLDTSGSMSQLERAALYRTPSTVDRVSDHEIQLSVAISLKRIADALWGDEGTTGIVQLLNDIEMNTRRSA